MITTANIPVVASPGPTTEWAYKPANGGLIMNVARPETGWD